MRIHFLDIQFRRTVSCVLIEVVAVGEGRRHVAWQMCAGLSGTKWLNKIQKKTQKMDTREYGNEEDRTWMYEFVWNCDIFARRTKTFQLLPRLYLSCFFFACLFVCCAFGFMHVFFSRKISVQQTIATQLFEMDR